MLRLCNVNKKFYQDKKLLFAIENISLDFSSSGLYAIIGPSGSGKSTLLSLIVGLEKMDSGYIEFDGKKITDFDWFIKNEVGILFQNYNLLDDYDGLFNYQLPLHYDDKEDSSKIYEKYNLNKDMMRRSCKTFSGGEKQRVALCRALIKNPQIIIADEPTGAIDYSNGVNLMKHLSALSKNHLVIVVTHNISLIRKYADFLIHINSGKVIKIEKFRRKKQGKEDRYKTKKGYSNAVLKVVKMRIMKSKINFILLIFAILLSLFTSSLAFTFSNNLKNEIKMSSENYIDYNVIAISKEKVVINDNSLLKMIQVLRPSINELYGIRKYVPFINYGYDLSAVLKPTIYDNDNKRVDIDIRFAPLFNFPSLGVNEVIVNNLFEEKFIEEEFYLKFNSSIKVQEEIKTLSISKKVKKILCRNENSNFNVPTIFYNYFAYESYLKSLYVDDKTSWLSLIKNAQPYESITNYAMILYLKRENVQLLEIFLKESASSDFSYSINSNAIRISTALEGINYTIQLIAKLFILLSSLAFCLVMIVSCYADTFMYRKESAIKKAMGIAKKKVFFEFILKNVFGLVIATLSSMALCFIIKRTFKTFKIFDIVFSNLFVGFENVIIVFFLIALLLIFLFTFLSYRLCSTHLYEELRNE